MLNLLYEDSELIVLDKAPGIVVHPGPGSKAQTLTEQLTSYTSQLSTIGGEQRPGIVHRLDKNTEGLMVIAKNNEAHEHLKEQFKNRVVKKRYWAIVSGNVQSDEKEIKAPLARHKRYRHKYTVNPAGKPARTTFYVKQRFNTKTLLDVWPETGRTHQIRVHLAHMGHPVMQDPEYGKKQGGTGQLLQAYYLSFTHPRNQLTMTFTLPLSERMANAL